VCAREKKGGRSSARTNGRDIDYREASPEMQVNLTCEASSRRWIITAVTANEFYYRTTAISEGAELVSCSPATTARYLTKLTSPSGPLTETVDALGHRVLVLKPHLQNREANADGPE